MNPETSTNPETKPEGTSAPLDSPATAPTTHSAPEPTPMSTPYPAYPPRRSKKKVILIVVGAVLAVAIALFAYFFWVGMRVLNASNDFMSKITTGKVAEAAALTDGASESSLQAAAAATKGSFKRLDQGTAASGDRKIVFVLYDLDGATAEQARTGLEMKDKKWKIVSFVYGKDLKLIPNSLDDSKSSTTTQPQSGGACLVASDFDTLYKAANGATRPSSIDYTKTDYTGNFHFNPDSLEFSAPAQLNTDKISYLAAFMKQNSSKQFTVHLKGRVATTAQSDLEFAKQRAEKIKSLLIAQGASASHIAVDEPGTVGDFGEDVTSNEAARRSARSVVATIDTDCAASDSNSNR